MSHKMLRPFIVKESVLGYFHLMVSVRVARFDNFFSYLHRKVPARSE